MSITFVKRSELPVPVKGKEATNNVTISESGQLIMSSLVNKFFEGVEQCVVAFDTLKVYIFKSDAPIVTKAITAKKISDKDLISIRRGEKNKNGVFSIGPVLQNAQKYGASVTYDYKASGNQQFEVTYDEKNGAVSFSLPESGKLEHKPVVKREKKAKAPATKANPGSTTGTPVQEEELVLEAAN